MTQLDRRLSLAAAVFSLVACGTPSSTTSAVVGARGATLALESGTQLVVPAGALTTDQAITIQEVHHGRDTAIELKPDGLELEHPAEISWNDDDASCERESGEHLESERDGGRGHHSMNKLETIWLRHHGEDRDGGEDHHADGGDDHGVDTDGGDDHGVDTDGGDDHGVDTDGGDDHGIDADGGVDAGDDHGGHSGHP